MTIEIHKPELEALIQERMASGRFLDLEDALMQAFEALPAAIGPAAPKRSVEEVFAMVRGLADDLEIPRDPSPPRQVDFS